MVQPVSQKTKWSARWATGARGAGAQPGLGGPGRISTSSSWASCNYRPTHKNSKTEVVNKIETVVVDVSLLQADLQKVADRVTETEQNVTALQQEIRTL
ncbi:hypothetical protein NDU88_000436 [Pleurodeles waltl]|uniref:Uncharacterized protein n=1 Tax=Pleurodeles waltl TaxID=8319 RepID=A0AAV7VXE1_PLEWA|nr:hypothetical protein NDU88_000436 [Pleurodeles waltl]